MENIALFIVKARKLIAHYIKEHQLEEQYNELDTIRFVFPEQGNGEIKWGFYYEKKLPSELINQLETLWGQVD